MTANYSSKRSVMNVLRSGLVITVQREVDGRHVSTGGFLVVFLCRVGGGLPWQEWQNLNLPR